MQGERALARLSHGYDEDGRDPYGEGSFPRPYIADEKGQVAEGGANEGMGSRTQADVTPGDEPTRKPEGGA